MKLRRMSAGHYMTRDGKMRILDTPEGWKVSILDEMGWITINRFRTFREARMSVRFITGR